MKHNHQKSLVLNKKLNNNLKLNIEEIKFSEKQKDKISDNIKIIK